MEADRGGNDNLRKVIVDTNVLMYIFARKADVLTQLRELGYRKFIFPVHIVRELENLSRSLEGNERRAALFALNIIESCTDCEVVDVEAEGSDNAILKLAEKENAAIITNDKILRKRAKEMGLKVGYLREMKYVEVDDDY